MDLCLIVTFYMRRKLLVRFGSCLYMSKRVFFIVVSHSLLKGTVLRALCNQTPRERGTNLWCFRGLRIPACLCSVGQGSSRKGEKHMGHRSSPDPTACVETRDLFRIPNITHRPILFSSHDAIDLNFGSFGQSEGRNVNGRFRSCVLPRSHQLLIL